MKNSLIEWCHHTVNFWWGCVFKRYRNGDVREECVHCYALMLSKIFSKGKATWGTEGKRWFRVEKAIREFSALDASARKRGVRERVFVNSMSDTFEDRPDLITPRGLLLAGAEMATNLDVLLLTKRPENVCQMVPREWLANWPSHVWIGTTAGTQKAYNESVPELLKIPAKIRFLSMEPLVEDVWMDWVQLGCRQWVSTEQIHWVICGGESGPKARPMHPAWAKSLRNQSKAAGVPFLFKQWGEWFPVPDVESAIARGVPEKIITYFPELKMHFARVGKKVAGRELDGVEHNEFPEVQS